MDLNKHIVKNENEGPTPFHTHGFAKIASGDRLGAVDSTPFSKRIQIENSRQLVGGYHRSTLGSTYNLSRPRLAKPSPRPGVNPQPPTAGRGGVPKRSFREPPSRGYNPYA